MAQTKVGDDVYGDDPTVNDLEQWSAQQHGFEELKQTSTLDVCLIF